MVRQGSPVMMLRAFIYRLFECYIAAFEEESEKRVTIAMGGGGLMVWPDGPDRDDGHRARPAKSAPLPGLAEKLAL